MFVKSTYVIARSISDEAIRHKVSSRAKARDLLEILRLCLRMTFGQIATPFGLAMTISINLFLIFSQFHFFPIEPQAGDRAGNALSANVASLSEALPSREVRDDLLLEVDDD